MRYLRPHCSEAGVSITEVLVSTAILMVVVSGLLGAFAMCIGQNKTQGEIGTRVTEYAQDKMEQLLGLSYTDTASNTAVYPTATTGGTGLTDGGGINTASPVTGYVDYLAADGSPLGTTATGALYKRLWQVSTASNLKTITVVTTAVRTEGGGGAVPKTTLVCFKSNFQ